MIRLSVHSDCQFGLVRVSSIRYNWNKCSDVRRGGCVITYVVGDIFTSPATVLVNTVNTVGVMGKGIARDFKAYFPEMFVAYQEACESGDLRIGTLQYFRTSHKSVLNFPTKRHWREKSRIEDIERGCRSSLRSTRIFRSAASRFPNWGAVTANSIGSHRCVP